MKKAIVKTISIMIILLGIFIINSQAANIEKIQEGQDGVTLSILTDNGLVNSLSATFQIEGEVSFETFQWAEKLNDTLKDYRYNKAENKLTLYITPGNGESLVEDGKIELGTIKVKGNGTQDYKINLVGINLVGANYTAVQEQVEDTDVDFEFVPDTTKLQSFDINLEASKQELNRGDEFEIYVKATNFKNIEEGLIVIGGQLEYNYEILEMLEIKGQNGAKLDEKSFNETNFKFITDNKVAEDENIFKIKFRVKNGIVVPKQTIFKLKSVTGSDGNAEIIVSDAQIELDIKEETVVTPEGIDSDKYVIDDEYISRIAPDTKFSEFQQHIQTEQKYIVKDISGNTIGEEDIIKTGMTLLLDNNKQFTLIVVGDLDGDGKFTINDIAKFKLHYIEKELLTGVYLKAADMDADKKVTVNDLAQMKLVYIGKEEIKE